MISKEIQKNLLLEAIEKAQGRGKCEYFSDGKPRCVIGQLASLNGTTKEELYEWDFLRGHEGSINSSVKTVLTLIEPESLQPFDSGLLISLQVCWDTYESDESAKAAMVSLVEAHYRE